MGIVPPEVGPRSISRGRRRDRGRGGAAGCVLASRLSETPHHRALLLEAGDVVEGDGASAPGAALSLFGSPALYNDESAPQAGARRPACRAADRPRA